MAESYSIADARRNLPMLIREAEAGKALRLTRRGHAVAVIVGCDLFERLQAGRISFKEAYEKFRLDADPAALDLDPDELFADVRDKSSGRDVQL